MEVSLVMLLGPIAARFPHTESNLAHARLLGMSMSCTASLEAWLPTPLRYSHEKLPLAYRCPMLISSLLKAVLAYGVSRPIR
jgi:hypothetical protein